MYESFYGLEEPPFNITPDPRFLFLSERHREAFDHLLFGISQRKGFIQLTGEVGAGKTTLCRALLEKLGEDYHTALVLNPCMTSMQLLRTILAEYGLESRTNDRVRSMERLNSFLLDQLSAHKDVVLVIDEAQDLSDENLEQVRLLSNLETDQRKLLQIVLLGQTELRDKLEKRKLRQLRQRITVRYHLRPLDTEETGFYIRHRLQVAGGNSSMPSFSRWAVWRIHRYSGGIPRLINAVCDKALLCGYVKGSEHLGVWDVQRAIRELEGRER